MIIPRPANIETPISTAIKEKIATKTKRETQMKLINLNE
jgi:hypothetical protein